MKDVIPTLDITTIIMIALIAGLVITVIAIVALAWALVADRLIRDSDAKKTLNEWLRSKFRRES